MTNGSTLVTGTGTGWEQDWFTGNAFWTAASDGVTGGDAVSYTATVTSPTTLTLNMPYQGPTAADGAGSRILWSASARSRLCWASLDRALRFGFEANANPQLPVYLAQMEQWLATDGYRPDARGLWYGRGFPNCEPISANNPWCSGGTVEQSRFLAGEIVGAVSAAYLASGNPAIAGLRG